MQLPIYDKLSRFEGSLRSIASENCKLCPLRRRAGVTRADQFLLKSDVNYMAFAFLERNWAAAPTPASRLPVRCSVARGTAAGTPASDAPEHLRQFSIPLQSPQRRRLSSAVAASVLQSPAAQTQNETGRILLLDYSSAVDPAGPSSGELTEAYSPSASHSALPQTSTTSQSARARRAASDVDVAADSAESDIELEEQRHQASPFPSPAPSPSSHSSSSSFTDSDLHFMRLALQQARRAAAADEVPVGAVLVAADGATVLAAGHNRVHRLRSPLAHAEMLCLAAGAARSRAWRLLGTTLYVTLEPCPMCAGALMQVWGGERGGERGGKSGERRGEVGKGGERPGEVGRWDVGKVGEAGEAVEAGKRRRCESGGRNSQVRGAEVGCSHHPMRQRSNGEQS